MRTQEEINRQVEGLKKMKDTLPEFSGFGDPNWSAINAQIAIITGKATYEAYEDEESYLEGEAYRAQEWLNGDINEDLFEE